MTRTSSSSTSCCPAWTAWRSRASCGGCGETPILMLTARGEDVDRIVGLEIGRRRLPRQALQPTRAGGARQGGPAPDRRAQRAAAGRSRSASCASTRGGGRRTSAARRLDLRPREFDLLAALARDPGVVLSRDALLSIGLGHRLPGRDADHRRPRGGASVRSSARTAADRDRPRRRLPTGAAASRAAGRPEPGRPRCPFERASWPPSPWSRWRSSWPSAACSSSCCATCTATPAARALADVGRAAGHARHACGSTTARGHASSSRELPGPDGRAVASSSS